MDTIKKKKNIDFRGYRKNTLLRRTQRRAQVTGTHDLWSYWKFLEASPIEVNFLTESLLIGVTKFFRDEHSFQLLQELALPEVLKNLQGRQTIRVWVPACSTGEEAYSIAILLHRYIRSSNLNLSLKVFATDINQASLDQASLGIYSRDVVTDCHFIDMEQYTIPKGNSVQIKPEIRNCITFANQNIISDPPFTRIDLISCRNVLIYFNNELQSKISRFLHFSLYENGVLFLGSSESLGKIAHEFDTLNARSRIFRKKRDLPLGEFQNFFNIDPQQQLRIFRQNTEKSELSSHLNHIQGTIPNICSEIIEKSSSSSFIVGHDRQILHIFNLDNRFIKSSSGRLNFKIDRIIETALSEVITSGISRAIETNKNQIFKNLSFTSNGRDNVKLTIQILVLSRNENLEKNLFFVSINEDSLTTPIQEEFRIHDIYEIRRSDFTKIQGELKKTKQSLCRLHEENELANEELQSINEELSASNEELQSTNQELQSVNEELKKMNLELKIQLGLLEEAKGDVDFLLNSSKMGVILLDTSMRIRKFNQECRELIALDHADIGHRLGDIKSSLASSDLNKYLDRLKQDQSFDAYECPCSGKRLNVSVIPVYKDKNLSTSRQTGVAITMTESIL